MPLVSQAQSRYFRAHENDKTKLGAVAREFIAASPGGPGSVKALPKRVAKPVAKPRKPPLPKSAGHVFGSLAPEPPAEE